MNLFRPVIYERRKIRLSGNLGLWQYEGGGNSNWELSYGLEGGIRIMKGVFVEAGYEKHENASIGDRFDLGVALKFSLPGFEGASYGDGSMSSNLYRMVEREKRILYEEREAVTGPRVSFGSITRGGSEIGEGDIIEGDEVNIEIRLDEAFEENVTLNLIGSGTATYGSSNDYTLSIGGTDCTGIMEADDCSITIMAGQMSASAVVNINFDGRGEGAETIILSTVIADGSNTGLLPGSPLVLTIPEDPPFPVVSIVRTGSETIAASEKTKFAQSQIWLPGPDSNQRHGG